MSEFYVAWQVCPNCKQRYQNQLALDLATEFVSFAVEKYSGTWGHVLALNLKQDALNSLCRSSLVENAGIDTLGLADEAKQVAHKILAMIEDMRTKDRYALTSDSVQYVLGNTYNNLGNLALADGTKEGAKKAVGYYEKFRDVCKLSANPNENGLPVAESSLAHAKSICDQGSVKEELKKYKKCYYQNVKERGEEALDSIALGLTFAIVLQKAHHGIEKERLVTKLAAISKQVYGSDHKTTQEAETMLQAFKERYVLVETRFPSPTSDAFLMITAHYQALQYKDEKTCVVQGPIGAKEKEAEMRGVPELEFATKAVAMDRIKFIEGTPVICVGLKNATHLNGKIGDIRKIHDKVHRPETAHGLHHRDRLRK